MPTENQMMTNAPSVLVVDDSWYVHSLARVALEGSGLEVHCASTAEEALFLYDQVKPGLVLMDVVLPDIDGITTAAHIRDRDPHALIIVVSGVSDQQARLRARQAGVLRFLAKPVTGRELVAEVHAALAVPPAPAWRLQPMPQPVLAA